MVIGGIWHGASWMYLLWGAYHGVLLACHKFIKQTVHFNYGETMTRVAQPFNVLITFTLVFVGFTFFRSPSLENLGEMATQIFTDFHAEVALQFVNAYVLVVVAILAGFLMHFAPANWQTKLSETYVKLPMLVQALVLAIVLFVVIQTRQSELVPFVYLQY
jgi:D-alanyl-lipoteichoic acid acyltransferase DltB (MBOAT superfamily)